MLKIFVITALVAAFVLFAAMVGMIAFSSEQSEADDHAKPAVAENSNSEDRKSLIDKAAANDKKEAKQKRDWYYTFIEHPTEWLLVLFNGLLVLATIALFVSGERNVEVARRAANAANRSAELAEKALIVTQRAAVRVSNFPWLWRPDFDPNRLGKFWYDITPHIENVGNTPTQDAKINVNYELRDTVLPDDFDFPFKLEAGNTIIGAKQTVGASHVIILDDELLQVQEGKKFFYIWGTITYRDGFESTPIRTTEFCAFISRVFGNPLDPNDPGNPKGTTVEMSFGIYAKHQKTD